MINCYTVERNAQILIYTLREYGIKNIIASPGTTNISFVYSVQQDPFFNVYSSADERSAAYMACGMAAETGMPVVISCTGATASRNYLPGLTEAYYRKLPIIAITSTQPRDRYGNLSPQFMDRRSSLNDVQKIGVYVPSIHCKEDELNAEVLICRALSSSMHGGMGPVHIDLETEYKTDYSIKKIPESRVIKVYGYSDDMPIITERKIGIYIGAHLPFEQEVIEQVDLFCEKYNSVVLCDQTSNYNGKYGVYASLLTYQENPGNWRDFDLIIDFGQVSGAYMRLNPKEVWRISVDGKIEDRFRRLTKVFNMSERAFFEKANCLLDRKKNISLYNQMKIEYDILRESIGDMPFSNIYTAQRMVNEIPNNSSIHFGILNSLRSWNFFDRSGAVTGFSNTGGFGIDGCMSALIGASLANPDKLFFGIVGDLAFFYDMNCLGNRHIGNNVRIMVINNGCGTEFKNYDHIANRFGRDADQFIAAMGHYGNKSKKLIKNYSNNLGFRYICANDKKGFNKLISTFTDPKIGDKSMIFEVFTNPIDESNSLKHIKQLRGDHLNGVICSIRQVKNEYICGLNEIVTFICDIEAEKYVWEYQYPNTNEWVKFIGGSEKSITRKMGKNYHKIKIRLRYKNFTDGELSMAQIIVLLKNITSEGAGK